MSRFTIPLVYPNRTGCGRCRWNQNAPLLPIWWHSKHCVTDGINKWRYWGMIRHSALDPIHVTKWSSVWDFCRLKSHYIAKFTGHKNTNILFWWTGRIYHFSSATVQDLVNSTVHVVEGFDGRTELVSGLCCGSCHCGFPLYLLSGTPLWVISQGTDNLFTKNPILHTASGKIVGTECDSLGGRA